MNTYSLKQLITTLCILVVPFSASAAGVADYISTPDDTPVSRAEFMRGVIKALELPYEGKQSTGSYDRPVPSAMQPYVGALESRNALEVFGSDLAIARNITRGQALRLLAALQKAQPSGIDVAFSDVKEGTALHNAVQVAVERGWMKPLTSTIFGVNRVLTGREARSVLDNVLGNGSGIESADQPTIPSVTIKYKKADPEQLPETDLLQTVWQILNDKYLYNQNIDDKDAAYAAAEALVNSLKDPYTTFLRPANARQLQTQIDGEVSGIGAQVEYTDNALVIVAPITGSPAYNAGLKSGDIILKINGESLAGLSLIQAVDKVRGERGSVVRLRILRDGSEFDVSITRDTIKVPEIDISFQNNIAIVRLVQFGQTTDRDLRSLMAQVQQQNPEGIVLDLRNNPGGLLHAAEIVISNFVPKGTGVAQITSRDETYTDVTQDPPTIDADVPVIVLVNKGSASASEIVAGALQDARRAIVLGEKTFGKGTVQQIIEFRDGSSMKLTIAEWYTPKGRTINGAGLDPDVIVPASDGRDEQLLRAIDLIR